MERPSTACDQGRPGVTVANGKKVSPGAPERHSGVSVMRLPHPAAEHVYAMSLLQYRQLRVSAPGGAV
jgi:hypothetical protein